MLEELSGTLTPHTCCHGDKSKVGCRLVFEVVLLEWKVAKVKIVYYDLLGYLMTF